MLRPYYLFIKFRTCKLFYNQNNNNNNKNNNYNASIFSFFVFVCFFLIKQNKVFGNNNKNKDYFNIISIHKTTSLFHRLFCVCFIFSLLTHSYLHFFQLSWLVKIISSIEI